MSLFEVVCEGGLRWRGRVENSWRDESGRGGGRGGGEGGGQ